MNHKQNPTKEELIALLLPLNDEAASHVIWVGLDGEVHIDPLPDDLTPVGYEKIQNKF